MTMAGDTAQAARVGDGAGGWPGGVGWDEDQCWTLARIAEVIRGRFRVGCTLAGVDLLLHRIGLSVQAPRVAGRGAECGADRGVAGGGVAGGKRSTWGRRGCTPVVEVIGAHGLRRPDPACLGGLAWVSALNSRGAPEPVLGPC